LAAVSPNWDQAVAEIGSGAVATQGDISNLADLDRVYATVEAQAGHIDVLAVNAGAYEFGTLGEITEEQFDRTSTRTCAGCCLPRKKRCLC
jgi:NAD(P)-dependent dehydrogenase (short-subunit alcohol dehydrogenase family)